MASSITNTSEAWGIYSSGSTVGPVDDPETQLGCCVVKQSSQIVTTASGCVISLLHSPGGLGGLGGSGFAQEL
jgi:hypothetical protein